MLTVATLNIWGERGEDTHMETKGWGLGLRLPLSDHMPQASDSPFGVPVSHLYNRDK